MAKVTYKEDCEPLSGIYCGVLYKVHSNGTCTARLQSLPSEEEVEKSPAARAEFIIKTCVSDIQRKMSDRHEAAKQYTNITHRVQRIYERLYVMEQDNARLQKLILDAYHQDRRVLPSRKLPQPGLFDH